MKKSLPESEQQKYEEYGEHMYSNITDKGDVANAFNETGEFNAAEIQAALRERGIAGIVHLNLLAILSRVSPLYVCM